MDHNYYYNSFRERKRQILFNKYRGQRDELQIIIKQIPWLRMNNRITIKNTIVRAFEITDASRKQNKFVENLLRKCDNSA